MKKLLMSLSLCLSMMLGMLTSVCAFEVNDLDQAYTKVVEYYKGIQELESPDEIIAVEALGLEADNYQLPDLESQTFEDLKLGDLSKSIMALTLIGKDPTDMNGNNLVELLENYVNEDGSIKDSDGSTTDIWVLLALESVLSNKVDIVADYLSTNTNEDGGFWYVYNEKFSSPDITGWGIEALMNANPSKYQDCIKGALEYLETTQTGKGVYGYSPNGDTQACVLEGLFAYDCSLVLNGTYDQDGYNPCETLLDFQGEDGSFFAEVYDNETWLPTGEKTFNAYTTLEAARCLGTYKNGSFVKRVQAHFKHLQEYKDLKDGDRIEIELRDGILSNNILNAVKGKNVELVVKFEGYSWIIHGKDIKSVKDIDLNVLFNTTAIDDAKIQQISKGNEILQFSTKTLGNFGFTATLKFSVNKSNAHMKLYNQDLKELNDIHSDDKGNVSLQLTEGSNYVFVFQTESVKAVETADQTLILDYSILLLGSLLVLKKGLKKKGLV